MNFNHYFNNDELETVLKAWAEKYPELVYLCAAGRSHEGRPIWLFSITNFSSGPDHEKPAIWLDGNIHATELAGTTTVLCILQYLLENYGTDEQVTRLLDASTFYAIPRINPDGAAAALSAPTSHHSGQQHWPKLASGGEPDARALKYA